MALYSEMTTARRPAKTPVPPATGVEGALWPRRGSLAIGGADRVALLEAIRDTGSMTRAAKAVGISYKTAWERVHDMNNVAEQPLVQRSAGGAGGGGTVLTAYALQLIAAFRQVEQEHVRMLGRLSRSMAEPERVLDALAHFSLRTSARNQLAGKVVGVRPGAVNAIVELALPGAADRIQVSLTMGSLQRLGITPGLQAMALIKAPAVFLAAPGAAPRLSVANCLQGEVLAIARGAVNAEVQARLAGGQRMVAMVGLDALGALAIEVGSQVQLLFQESSVILGVA
jgi:molybdate transport system regulatory protein